MGGLFCAFQAFINPGDQVISIEPYFNLYKVQVEVAGGEFIGIPLQFSPSSNSYSSKDFKLDFNLLRSKITKKTKMIIINTPHNPTVSFVTLKQNYVNKSFFGCCFLYLGKSIFYG